MNVDSTLILAAPKISPHAKTIREHVAELLGVAVNCVGLKAKTPEGMGTDNAAIAHAVVLIEAMKTTEDTEDAEDKIFVPPGPPRAM